MFAQQQVRDLTDDNAACETLSTSLAQSIAGVGKNGPIDDLFWIEAVDDVLIVAVTDTEGEILYANQKFCAISGYSQAELIGSNHRILNSRTHDRNFFADMFRTIRGGKTWRGEICNRSKDGQLYWVATTIIPRLNAAGVVSHYVACRFDISEQKQAQIYLAEAASTDSLTGLLNRFAFQNTLNARLRNTQTGYQSAALAMIDIDSFKDVNDIYGHQTGDELLKIVAKRIERAVNPLDVVARFGGDEIVLLFSNLFDEEDMKARLDRLQNIIQLPIELEGTKTQISASIGVSRYPEDSRDPSDLVKKADMALYSAKRLGRNRYEFYGEALQQAITKRVRLHEEARLGLLRGEFRLHYQPILNLHTGRIDSMEALLRWQHPVLGLIAPGQFLEVFDDVRLTAMLGSFVRETAVRCAAQWTKQGVDFGRIAVNTTSADFARPGLAQQLLADLASHCLTSKHIAIEVTEGMFLGKQAGRVREELALLHAAGFEIAFDDFGTGFASLTHLKELPLDRIKIDRSFIQDIEHNDADRKIVKSIIDLAHNLGLNVTAEGIEGAGQFDMLKAMGCDKIQGYLISRPVEASQIGEICQMCFGTMA